jgi:hypothetical protein
MRLSPAKEEHMHTDRERVSFGVKTSQSNVTDAEILRVMWCWRPSHQARRCGGWLMRSSNR